MDEYRQGVRLATDARLGVQLRSFCTQLPVDAQVPFSTAVIPEMIRFTHGAPPELGHDHLRAVMEHAMKTTLRATGQRDAALERWFVRQGDALSRALVVMEATDTETRMVAVDTFIATHTAERRQPQLGRVL